MKKLVYLLILKLQKFLLRYIQIHFLQPILLKPKYIVL